MDEAPQAPTLSPLARQVAEDIQRRGLGPGEAYLTAARLGERFGVSPATANRALKQLQLHGVVDRRQRRGTFIAEGYAPRPVLGLGTFLVFMPESRRSRLGDEVQELMGLLFDEFEGAAVQVCPIPDQGSERVVSEMLSSVQSRAVVMGVIAISCSEEAYEVLDRSGHPLVVLGNPYPGQEHLASIGPDLATAGTLLAGHLISRGCLRLVLLQVVDVRPGDDHFLNGVMHAMAGAGLPANALQVAYISDRGASTEERIRGLVSAADKPLGFVLNGLVVTQRVIQALDRVDDGDSGAEVVFYHHATPALEGVERTHARSSSSGREMLELAIEMLRSQREGGEHPGGGHLVPVELRVGGETP